jgi:hypothetical protein
MSKKIIQLTLRKEVVMKMDIPLTDFFECPSCGFRGLFNAEPAAHVKCICGRWWVIGDYEYYMSLTHKEREKIRMWEINFYKDHRELNHGCFDGADTYS